MKGAQFYELHELYDTLAGTILGDVGMIAERATMLGGIATGTVRMAAGSTRLEEYCKHLIGCIKRDIPECMGRNNP